MKRNAEIGFFYDAINIDFMMDRPQRNRSPAYLSMIAFTMRVAAHPSTAGDVLRQLFAP
jgi:hypothetical protein